MRFIEIFPVDSENIAVSERNSFWAALVDDFELVAVVVSTVEAFVVLVVKFSVRNDKFAVVAWSNAGIKFYLSSAVGGISADVHILAERNDSHAAWRINYQQCSRLRRKRLVVNGFIIHSQPPLVPFADKAEWISVSLCVVWHIYPFSNSYIIQLIRVYIA